MPLGFSTGRTNANVDSAMNQLRADARHRAEQELARKKLAFEKSKAAAQIQLQRQQMAQQARQQQVSNQFKAQGMQNDLVRGQQQRIDRMGQFNAQQALRKRELVDRMGQFNAQQALRQRELDDIETRHKDMMNWRDTAATTAEEKARATAEIEALEAEREAKRKTLDEMGTYSEGIMEEINDWGGYGTDVGRPFQPGRDAMVGAQSQYMRDLPGMTLDEKITRQQEMIDMAGKLGMQSLPEYSVGGDAGEPQIKRFEQHGQMWETRGVPSADGTGMKWTNPEPVQQDPYITMKPQAMPDGTMGGMVPSSVAGSMSDLQREGFLEGEYGDTGQQVGGAAPGAAQQPTGQMYGGGSQGTPQQQVPQQGEGEETEQSNVILDDPVFSQFKELRNRMDPRAARAFDKIVSDVQNLDKLRITERMPDDEYEQEKADNLKLAYAELAAAKQTMAPEGMMPGDIVTGQDGIKRKNVDGNMTFYEFSEDMTPEQKQSWLNARTVPAMGPNGEQLGLYTINPNTGMIGDRMLENPMIKQQGQLELNQGKLQVEQVKGQNIKQQGQQAAQTAQIKQAEALQNAELTAAKANYDMRIAAAKAGAVRRPGATIEPLQVGPSKEAEAQAEKTAPATDAPLVISPMKRAAIREEQQKYVGGLREHFGVTSQQVDQALEAGVEPKSYFEAMDKFVQIRNWLDKQPDRAAAFASLGDAEKQKIEEATAILEKTRGN